MERKNRIGLIALGGGVAAVFLYAFQVCVDITQHIRELEYQIEGSEIMDNTRRLRDIRKQREIDLRFQRPIETADREIREMSEELRQPATNNFSASDFGLKIYPIYPLKSYR